MSGKTFIWFGLFVGGTIGGYLPALWGGSLFSFSSILLSGVGSVLGIWAGYKLAKATGAL